MSLCKVFGILIKIFKIIERKPLLDVSYIVSVQTTIHFDNVTLYSCLTKKGDILWIL